MIDFYRFLTVLFIGKLEERFAYAKFVSDYVGIFTRGVVIFLIILFLNQKWQPGTTGFLPNGFEQTADYWKYYAAIQGVLLSLFGLIAVSLVSVPMEIVRRAIDAGSGQKGWRLVGHVANGLVTAGIASMYVVGIIGAFVLAVVQAAGK